MPSCSMPVGAFRSTALAFRRLVHGRPDSITRLHQHESIEFAGYEFAVQHAPGHSPGNVLLIADELVFSDVIFRGSIGRTDLPFPTRQP